MNYGGWQNSKCYFDAHVIWRTHSKAYWANWALLFHWNCNLRIQDDMDFMSWSQLICERLIKDISDCFSFSNADELYPDVSDSISTLKQQYSQICNRIEIGAINALNVEDTISDLRYLSRWIFNSQAFHDYTQYKSILSLTSKISSNQICDYPEFNDPPWNYLNLLSNFKLNETEFKEKYMKELVNEFVAQISEIKTQVSRLEQNQIQNSQQQNKMNRSYNNINKHVLNIYLLLETE